MRIGLAGLGNMGAGLGARLLEVGHQLMVWNRTPAKAAPLASAGAVVAASPAELAQRVEIVITTLTDAAAIEAVYGGAAGLLSAAVSGKLFIDMSTVEPATAVALAQRVRAKGAAFVECPVGGSVGVARQGKLLGLMGAEPDDAARARAVLEPLCRRIEHCGPVGAGSTMKLAINLPLMISWQALGEAFATCRDVGFEPQRLLDLFTDTSGATHVLKVFAPMIVAALEGRDPGPAAFSVDSARKDLRAMLAHAAARGIALPLVERTLASFDAVGRGGMGGRDASSLPVYWSKRDGEP